MLTSIPGREETGLVYLVCACAYITPKRGLSVYLWMDTVSIINRILFCILKLQSVT